MKVAFITSEPDREGMRVPSLQFVRVAANLPPVYGYEFTQRMMCTTAPAAPRQLCSHSYCQGIGLPLLWGSGTHRARTMHLFY